MESYGTANLSCISPQILRLALAGRIVQPGKIEGQIEVRTFEQRVLGAKPNFLNRSPEIEPNPKESRFSMTLVNNDSTCESLRNSAAPSKKESGAN